MSLGNATYRIQLRDVGGFGGVRKILPHLRALGVSTLYLSPIQRARSGSAHGYDVVDPDRVDPALGGEDGFDRLASACEEAEIRLLLDIVPNHMAASHENPWWWSVLEEGPRSPYAAYFDVEWNEPPEPVRGKVVLPVLGRRYLRVLEAGEFHVVRGRESFLLRYRDRVLPLATGNDGHAPDPRHLNRAADDAEARKALDGLLSHQAYWLVHWRTAPEELNYRRFFNVADLVALRMEREEVFRAWHRGVARLLQRPAVAGLRVDHVDGLRDPGTYLSRLRRLVREVRAGVAGPARSRSASPVSILVEKILARDEHPPDAWDVDGTTGYDFLAAEAVLVSPEGEASLGERYRLFTDTSGDFGAEARRARRQVARMHFRRDLDRLVEDALPLVRSDPRGRDLSPSEVEGALLEITARLPVYRTYRTGPGPGPARQAAAFREAVAGALRHRGQVPTLAFEVVGDLLEGRIGGAAGLDLTLHWQQLSGAVMAKGVEDTAFYRFGPLVSRNEVGADPEHPPLSVEELHTFLARRGERAPGTLNATSTHDTKRSEDVRTRIHVLSELAAEWGRRVEMWHEWNRNCRGRAGGRSVPTPAEEWLLYQTLAGVWPLDPGELPDLGARVEEFLVKAAREAKEGTSWHRPRKRHEEALRRFVRAILDPDRNSPFLDDFLSLHDKISFYGAVNSLALLVLKTTAPGIPDFYQGSELWRFDLVDPDNRRHLDRDRIGAAFAALRSALDNSGPPEEPPAVPPNELPFVPQAVLQDLLEEWRDGRIKLFTTWRILRFRRDREALFREGSYRGVETGGARSDHVVAFTRRRGDEWVLAVLPRLSAGLAPAGRPPMERDVWKDTFLTLPPDDPPHRWRDVLTGADRHCRTGGRLEVARLLDRFPVAVLYGRRGRERR